MIKKELYDIEGLFEQVQLNAILEDGKTFVDCIPKFSIEEIEAKYLQEKQLPGFDYKNFVLNNFTLPEEKAVTYESKKDRPVEENIRALWDELTRKPVKEESTLINLPFVYIVPGGRFREIYYWDSYFTMQGLKEHGRVDLIESMIDNFAYLIRTYGHIPNGNRKYYLSRSQPPFFALMVKLLAEIKKDENVYLKYGYELQKEYTFWQLGSGDVTAGNAKNRVVKMPGGEWLNRYFDNIPQPRQESYAEDVHVSKLGEQPAGQLFTNLRAGAESGWDFSSRWFADSKNIATIETTSIVPVDLNCLLYTLENIISKTMQVEGNENAATEFANKAQQRKDAILKYCWSDKQSFFCDYHLTKQRTQEQITAAGLFPLFVHIATPEQAKAVAGKTQSLLLKEGGIVTTTENTGQQWDAPNGWAPLQWIAYVGLSNYHHQELAAEIANRWLTLNESVFAETGKLMEKYNVEDLSKPAGGGEYAGQDGFGWTNGVYMALKNSLNKSK